MARPFNAPVDREQYLANHAWRVQQLAFPPDQREPLWQFESAFNLDAGEMMPGYGPDGLLDPFVPRFRANFGAPRPRAEREREDMPSNIGAMKRYPALNLDKVEPGPDIPRDIKLPPFKIDYDTHEQIHQKLCNTVILIKNRPYCVSETVEVKKGEFGLIVYDTHREQRSVMYNDVADCRGIAPGYFIWRGGAYWTYRVPERQNSQGMCQRNMHTKLAGTNEASPARHEFLLDALGLVKDVYYASNLHDIILGGGSSSIRVNSRVALYGTKKKGAPIGVEYCGRPLGLIVNGQCKVYDESDLTPSWIHKDVNQAGLVLSA